MYAPDSFVPTVTFGCLVPVMFCFFFLTIFSLDLVFLLIKCRPLSSALTPTHSPSSCPAPTVARFPVPLYRPCLAPALSCVPPTLAGDLAMWVCCYTGTPAYITRGWEG